MKTDHDIEQLLASGKTHSLSATDKHAIKSLLLSHAAASLQHEPKQNSLPWTAWFLRGSFSFASLLIIFVGTAYAAQDSLPGEPLYALKVHVVEEVIALTKTETSERIAYDLSLMETRLSELQTVSEQTPILSTADLVILSNQIDEHTKHLTDIITAAETTELPHEEKIDLLSQLSGITQAQAALTITEDSLLPITETILDIQSETADSLEEAVQDFAETQEIETVQDYLHEQITDVSEQFTASTTDETTRDFVEYHLTEASDALKDGVITDAIVSVLEAQQTIEAEAYLSEDSRYTEELGETGTISDETTFSN